MRRKLHTVESRVVQHLTAAIKSHKVNALTHLRDVEVEYTWQSPALAETAADVYVRITTNTTETAQETIADVRGNCFTENLTGLHAGATFSRRFYLVVNSARSVDYSLVSLQPIAFAESATVILQRSLARKLASIALTAREYLQSSAESDAEQLADALSDAEVNHYLTVHKQEYRR
jgi:hypothetical protein